MKDSDPGAAHGESFFVKPAHFPKEMGRVRMVEGRVPKEMGRVRVVEGRVPKGIGRVRVVEGHVPKEMGRVRVVEGRVTILNAPVSTPENQSERGGRQASKRAGQIKVVLGEALRLLERVVMV